MLLRHSTPWQPASRLLLISSQQIWLQHWTTHRQLSHPAWTRRSMILQTDWLQQVMWIHCEWTIFNSAGRSMHVDLLTLSGMKRHVIAWHWTTRLARPGTGLKCKTRARHILAWQCTAKHAMAWQAMTWYDKRWHAWQAMAWHGRRWQAIWHAILCDGLYIIKCPWSRIRQ